MTRARDLGDFIADGGAPELVVDTTTLVVDSTNNRVGIGTASPSAALDVTGDVSIADKIIHTGDTNTAIRFPAADTVTVETGGSEAFRIDSDGNVGISGAASAFGSGVATLQLKGKSSGKSAAIRFIDNGGTDIASIFAQNDTTYGLSIGTNGGTGDFVRFHTGGLNTERFRFGSSGQLGIAGANYGTSGQVLTSGGSSAAPTWSTVSGGATSVNGLSDGYADSTNIGLGDVAFDSISSGTNNVFLGITTGGNLDSGQSNVGVGKGALENLSTGQGNVALNFEALNSVTTTSNNIGIGRYSGRYTTGNANIAIGEQALEGASGSTTGSNNVCIGLQAAHSATSLYESVILGYQAGCKFTTSERPVAVGYKALYNCTTGNKNVGIGVEAGKGSSSGFTGQRNIFIGDEGGAAMTSGTDCIFMGRQAGHDNTTGSYNIALGNGSAGLLTTGSNNVFIGQRAGNALITGSNNICLGYDSDPVGSASSDSVTLGNSSIGTLRCQTQTITGLSDVRDKESIVDLDAGLDFVDRLKPVSFIWNMRDGGKVGQKDIGFIAQDLQQVQKDTGIEIPNLVYDVNPEKLEASYGKLLPIMVTAIQELSKKVKALEAQLNT